MSDRTLRSSTHIAWHWVIIGGLALATLDALFASGYWRVAAGLSWVRVFQSVAAGVLGMEASLAGGTATGWLGLGLHYLIAMSFVVVYTLVAARMPVLVRRPLALGALYGLLLYVIMNCVVVPLSAIGKMPKFDNVPWVASSIVMHAVFGVICALAAQRALSPVSVRRPVLSAH